MLLYEPAVAPGPSLWSWQASAVDLARCPIGERLMGPLAVELVDELNAAGYQTACLSNTNAAHWKLMTTVGCENYLPLDRLTHQR